MLSWKLHVRKSMSPRKSAFRVFITPSILNKNGGDRLRKTSISSIFEEEILENCRFWEVQTSGFGLCIIYPNYLSCFKVVPEPGQRNISNISYELNRSSDDVRNSQFSTIASMSSMVTAVLASIPLMQYPSDANFILYSLITKFMVSRCPFER